MKAIELTNTEIRTVARLIERGLLPITAGPGELDEHYTTRLTQAEKDTGALVLGLLAFAGDLVLPLRIEAGSVAPAGATAREYGAQLGR